VLPEYERPPITEVVAGVAFRRLPDLTTARLCELWLQKWKADFPKTEEHAPYVPPIERFDGPPSGSRLSLEMVERPETRHWFLTPDGQELIQLQRDWFACNWRKVMRGAAYDRWHKRRDVFRRHYSDLEGFVGREKLGELVPTQCEVAYVNHIVTGEDPLTDLGKLPKLLRVVQPLRSDLVPAPEQMQVGMSFVIRDESDVAVGRLHVAAQPAIRKEDRKPMVVLNLTARGRPEGEGLDGVMKFLDRGRERIVWTFTELTTDDMHKQWGRYA
jgi:uncharacterized protein (TIGR04255 family)